MAQRLGAHDEGKAYFPAQQSPTPADAWISGTDEHEKRAAGAQASPRERPETPHCQQRIAAFGPSMAFRREERIRRRADFRRVYDQGAKLHGRYGTVFMAPNNLQVGRLGIAATKKLGGAVARNRAKRLIREVFRRNKIAPGFDLVVVPKRELLGASLTTLEAEYRRTIERRLRQLSRAE
jgi:ribonuclease P protein component